MSDLISRQAAIELIHTLYPSAPIMRMNRKRWEEKYKPYIEAEKALEKLPSVQPDIDEFLRNKSPKEHREILHWIACHYYPKDSKEVLQAVSNVVRPDMRGDTE